MLCSRVPLCRDGVKTSGAANVTRYWSTFPFEREDNRTCGSILGTGTGYRVGLSYNTMWKSNVNVPTLLCGLCTLYRLFTSTIALILCYKLHGVA